MQKPEIAGNFHLFLSPGDLDMIVSAIGAYSHNLHYRDLLTRLEHQTNIGKDMARRSS